MSTCYAPMFPVFQPAMRIIAAITTTNPAIVTTTFAHQYKDGTIVRLDIPSADGMPQMNGLTGTITITSSTTFAINIDATSFQPFAIPISPLPQTNTCAMVVPIGEVSATLQAATVNVLPY